MARHLFHVVNSQFIPDTSGTECATADDVEARAIVAAGEALSEQGLETWRTGRWYMFVTDEQNMTHLKLAFDAEDLTGKLS